MTGTRLRRPGGFSLLEILITLGVLAIFLVGFFQFLGQTKTDTAKATRYVQALHLAQETLDLALSAPMDEAHRTKIEQTGGSLVDSGTGKAVAVPVASGTAWGTKDLTYPDHYNGAFFLRRIRFRSIPGGVHRHDLLEVTVVVSWNEGAAPEHLEPIVAGQGRERTIELAALTLDERQPY